jgi:hypothetical protein
VREAAAIIGRLAFGLWLAVSLSAGAAESSTVITEKPTRHSEGSARWHGLEFGTTFSLPIPAASASHDEVGLDVGFSVTSKPNSRSGVGVDVAYHHWPVAGAFKETFNELLRRETLNTLELGGTTWRLNTLQLTGHIKFAAPADWVPRPWVQVGAGSYRVDPNTTGFSGDAGFFRIVAGPLKPTADIGFYVMAGIDLIGGPRTQVGLNASYHGVNCHEVYGSDLRVFSIGAHVTFGVL